MFHYLTFDWLIFAHVQAYATEVSRKEHSHLALSLVRFSSYYNIFMLLLPNPQLYWAKNNAHPFLLMGNHSDFFLTCHRPHCWSSHWWLSCTGNSLFNIHTQKPISKSCFIIVHSNFPFLKLYMLRANFLGCPCIPDPYITHLLALWAIRFYIQLDTR